MSTPAASASVPTPVTSASASVPTTVPEVLAPWHGQTDETAVAYIANKGWQSPADMLRSYQGAEKLIGRDPSSTFMVPKPGDTDGWDEVFAKLGRPASADKYELTSGLPEGMQPDKEFMGQIGQMFHKYGLNGEQAKGLSGEYNAMVAARAKQADDNSRMNLATDKAALLKDWGGGYERMMNSAQTAVAALGFTAAEIDAMENAIGFKAVMTKFADLGQKLSDPKFVSDSSNGGARFSGTMTPGEAKAQIGQLKLDQAFKAALFDRSHPGHKEAAQKWSDLHTLGYGNEAIRG